MGKIRTKGLQGKEAAARERAAEPLRRVQLDSVLVRAKQALREVMLSAGTDVLMAMLAYRQSSLQEETLTHCHADPSSPLH